MTEIVDDMMTVTALDRPAQDAVPEAAEYIDARDGNACSVCGDDFRPGDTTVPYGVRDDRQQHAHVGGCPGGVRDE